MALTLAQPPALSAEVIGAKEYRDALSRYLSQFGGRLHLALRDEFGKLLGHVIRLTPPRTERQGWNAVRRQLGYAVRLLTPRQFRAKKWAWVREQIAGGNHDALQRFFRKFKGASDISGAEFAPFRSQMHQGQRDRRGRVQQRRNVRFATTDKAGYDAHLKRKQANVGMGKGGWVAGLSGVGAGIPGGSAFAVKHRDKGRFKDRLATLGYLTQENFSPWAGGNQEAAVVGTAIRSRTKAILQSLDAAAGSAARKAGL